PPVKTLRQFVALAAAPDEGPRPSATARTVAPDERSIRPALSAGRRVGRVLLRGRGEPDRPGERPLAAPAAARVARAAGADRRGGGPAPPICGNARAAVVERHPRRDLADEVLGSRGAVRTSRGTCLAPARSVLDPLASAGAGGPGPARVAGRGGPGPAPGTGRAAWPSGAGAA